MRNILPDKNLAKNKLKTSWFHFLFIPLGCVVKLHSFIYIYSHPIILEPYAITSYDKSKSEHDYKIDMNSVCPSVKISNKLDCTKCFKEIGCSCCHRHIAFIHWKTQIYNPQNSQFCKKKIVTFFDIGIHEIIANFGKNFRKIYLNRIAKISMIYN